MTNAPATENLLVFGGDATEISARTRVFFNRRGDITEADIVFNPYQQFSTDGSLGTFDFESTLTHEIGHLLGLEHSSVTGATMNEFQGKNGTFNLSIFSQRTLSQDDITQIRAIYGAKEDANCCGGIDGKLSFTNPKSGKDSFVWLEETSTGRVTAGGKINSSGAFSFKGINEGIFRLYMQDLNGSFAGEYLGDVEISKGKTTGFFKKVTLSTRDFDVQFTGFNGQLGKLAIPINSGKTYQVYIGGKNLNPVDFKVGSTSPYLTFSNQTVTDLDYGNDLSVFTFEVKVLNDIPAGDYTIYLQKTDGKVEYIAGTLTIEKFLNQWSIITAE